MSVSHYRLGAIVKSFESFSQRFFFFPSHKATSLLLSPSSHHSMNFHPICIPPYSFQMVCWIEPYTYSQRSTLSPFLPFSCNSAKCPLGFHTCSLGKTQMLAPSKDSSRNSHRYDELNPTIYLKRKEKKNTFFFIFAGIQEIYYFILSDKVYITSLLHCIRNITLYWALSAESIKMFKLSWAGEESVLQMSNKINLQ